MIDSIDTKLEAFWHKAPDVITLEQFADGMIIEFTHNKKLYRINTHVVDRPRIVRIAEYYELLEQAVLNATPVN